MFSFSDDKRLNLLSLTSLNNNIITQLKMAWIIVENSTGKRKEKSCKFISPNSDPCIHKEVKGLKAICMKWCKIRQISFPLTVLGRLNNYYY